MELYLLKLLYVGMLNASAKWTMPISKWGQTVMQLSIYFLRIRFGDASLI